LPDDDHTALGAERDVLCAAIHQAGETALDYFRDDNKVTKKQDNTPVTEADFASDRVLRDRLLSAFPDYGWISEESAQQTGRHNNRTWIVDPIDGTRAFVRGHEDWCISAALIDGDRPVLAAIFLPCSDDLYLATFGGGASLNGHPLQTSGRSDVAGCRMIGYQDLFRSRKWAKRWPTMTIESYNSMAVRMARVAQGHGDATLTVNAKSDWDLAAADLLVQEAGGIVTDIWGEPFRYGRSPLRKPNVLASGAMLHGNLVDLSRGWQGQTAG